ncbi:BatA domain-containing protein [Sphingomonas sp. I4]
MPTLLAPAALAVLAALAIPLLIHLARRTEQRRTDFAALRWLRAKPRPRQRPRFEEWPLLIVRLLLLAMLALWLARPVTPAAPDLHPRIYVVPGLTATAATPWLSERAEGYWLAPASRRWIARPRPAPSRSPVWSARWTANCRPASRSASSCPP